MTVPKQVHETIVIERILPNCLAHVWSAWASSEKKKTWFGKGLTTFDFQPGGTEQLTHVSEMGTHTNETRYFEIKDFERVVFAYSVALTWRVHTVRSPPSYLPIRAAAHGPDHIPSRCASFRLATAPKAASMDGQPCWNCWRIFSPPIQDCRPGKHPMYQDAEISTGVPLKYQMRSVPRFPATTRRSSVIVEIGLVGCIRELLPTQ